MDCVEKAAKWIDTHGLVCEGSRVLAALSGGPDSMAMITILAELSGRMGFRLAAAHFDHGIRPGSARDCALSADYCASLGVQLFTGSADVPAEAKRSRLGLEEKAREMRYDFLESTARGWKADAVALGHNRDDQVETVLHHFIRGSGWRGLTGMPVSRGIYIRPILCLSREEITSFLRERGVRWCTDSTNKDNAYLRNRIRNRLIPYLEKDFNPSIGEAILRTRENVLEGWAALAARIEGIIPEPSADGSVTIGSDRLEGLSDFDIYLLVDSVLRERFGITRDIEKKHFDAAKRLIRASSSGKRTSFPHGMTLRREHGAVRFEKGDRTARRPAKMEVLIPSAGVYDLPCWGMILEIIETKASPGKVVFGPRDAVLANVAFPLKVRARRAGDRIVPFGMRGRKKLSDIFIDSKIPARIRDDLPVFEDLGGVFWVPGVVAAERTRVTAAGAAAVRMKLSPLPEEPGGA